jgi:3-oxoacyl-[acyl-carrier-protein] synthase II
VSKVLITGTGLVTPLGQNTEETWRALLSGKFITDHSRAAGEFDRNSPRVFQMARRAADQAIAEAHWGTTDDYATIIGTSKGSVESWLSPLLNMAMSTYIAGGLRPSGLADIAEHIAVGYGPRLTLSCACASGLMSLIRGVMMIRSGEASRVLVVAAEASVHPLFLGSFKRLGVLADPKSGCRPFDQNRDGFLMSEAAAAICLEAAHDHPTNPSVAIDRFAMGADATHLTANDPAGRVLQHLIRQTIKTTLPIDLIHAHGTGTINNDPIELAAIESVFPDSKSPPSLYSHKGALGHSLGAAGLVATVLSVMAHREGIVPRNVRTINPLTAQRITISQTAIHRPVHRSLIMAAGFGGGAAAVSLESC